MTIEQAILERLLDMPALSALVSTRVYQMKLPQRPQLPAVRVQHISDVDELHMRGPSPFVTSRIQVDAYASEASGVDPYSVATSVAAAIHGDGLGDVATGLHGWIGYSGGSPPSLRISYVTRLSRRQMYDADELRLVRVLQDYRVDWVDMS